MILLGTIASSFRDAAPAPEGKAFRYYRLFTIRNTGSTSFTEVSELILAETPGGPTICTGGTPFASTVDGGSSAANAFDGSSATYWRTSNTNEDNCFIGYDLGAGNEKTVTQMRISSSTTAGYQPRIFALQGSDDNTTWYNMKRVGTGYEQAFWNSLGAGNLTSLDVTPAPASDPLGHRYWRLFIVDAADGIYATVGEMQLRTEPGAFNESERAKATALSQASTNTIPDYAICGTTEFVWTTAFNQDINTWIRLDLGPFNQRAITELKLISPNADFDRMPQNFRVEYSDDDSTWTTAYTAPAQAAWTANETRTYSW